MLQWPLQSAHSLTFSSVLTADPGTHVPPGHTPWGRFVAGPSHVALVRGDPTQPSERLPSRLESLLALTSTQLPFCT